MRQRAPLVKHVLRFHSGEPHADGADDPERADGFPERRVARRVLGEHAGGVRRVQPRVALHEHARRLSRARLRGVVQRRGQGPEVLRAHVRARRDEHAQGLGGVGAGGEVRGGGAAPHASDAHGRAGADQRRDARGVPAGGGPVDGEALRVVARDEEIVTFVARPDRRRSVRRREKRFPTLEQLFEDSDPPEPRRDVRDGLAADGPRVELGAVRQERFENLKVTQLGGAVKRRRARAGSAVHELVRGAFFLTSRRKRRKRLRRRLLFSLVFSS